MSLAPLSVPEHKSSQPNSNQLGSNNPFRNRTLPSSTSPVSPNFRPERPRSTNPFLDTTEMMSPQSAPAGAVLSPSSDKHPFAGNTAELFENLTLDSKPKERRPAPPRPDKPSSSSRPRQEIRDRERHRDPSRDKRREEDPFDIFADPPKKKESRSSRPRDGRPPRPRRNSESSIMEKPKAIDSEEERRRRERRHREGKSRSKRTPGYRLDVIDKLDVTSIFGTGVFHHDGPFDACNPNRNRKGSRQAPMQAFPKDSKNMALGGSGPINSSLNLELIHGHTSEGYLDYSATAVSRKGDAAFDSAKAEVIHGTESMGLGTSTFLEGTPASRSAIQRRQSETENQPQSNGGIQRTKSLANRFKGINRTGTVRVSSPESMQTSPSSAGPTVGSSRANERNPFFQDYDEAYDTKGVKIEETVISGRLRASSSPRRTGALERNATNGSIGADEIRQNGGGFMNRMKSLRRPRPERPERRLTICLISKLEAFHEDMMGVLSRVGFDVNNLLNTHTATNIIMTTSQNEDIYTSRPAFPVLASTLVPPPLAIWRPQPPAEQRANLTTTWNLEPSLSNAFSSLSRHDHRNENQGSERLLRCGIIIGLSYLREWWEVGDSESDSQLRDLLGDISRRLLASSLRGFSLPPEEQQQQRQQPAGYEATTPTRVFIIHPVHSTTFAPETLFDSLVAIKKSSLDNDEADTTDPISQAQALHLLDQVELLPVHDFASATQAISQVSDALSKIYRSYQEQQLILSNDDDKDDHDRNDDPPTTLLIIEGLDTMTESIIHNSNAMRGSAVLTPALRTLTHLSRTHASFLSVLLVNTIALGPGMPPAAASQPSSTDLAGIASQSPLTTSTSTSTGGLYSVFSRERPMRQKHAGLSQNEPENNEPLPLLNTLLSRTLDQGIDTHLLLQGRRRSQTLVEVIKDRTGDGLGRWCVWK
ncbi:hypothetical protein UA08_04117 [Talaromyces atroroseus]|uniref:Uncharacterized protein n=1 Tax=Talaromyces atroroseus TaxID=1441469 RepID=A0A1Q5Q9A2_TALAT|nr:hypothetical protein UA08_04117 [Talaromyces atroroseus]OKL60707.1 hypothetical protein UA08_04117 [Talaromyces atroroseus]